MSSEMLNWVYISLQRDEEVVVPLKRLWRQKYGTSNELSFEEFARKVLCDERFEEMYSVDHDPELEAFDCFSGPRVKLKSREITEQCVLRLVQKHNERVVRVLLRALEILREESKTDPKADLTEAVLMLEQLRPAFRPWVHLKPGDQTT